MPRVVRFLQWLVIGLTLTMIAGLITVVGVVVTRFPKPPSLPQLPAEVTLPDGAVPRAVTFGPDWYAVVTGAEEILVFGRADGALWQRIAVTRP